MNAGWLSGCKVAGMQEGKISRSAGLHSAGREQCSISYLNTCEVTRSHVKGS